MLQIILLPLDPSLGLFFSEDSGSPSTAKKNDEDLPVRRALVGPPVIRVVIVGVKTAVTRGEK